MSNWTLRFQKVLQNLLKNREGTTCCSCVPAYMKNCDPEISVPYCTEGHMCYRRLKEAYSHDICLAGSGRFPPSLVYRRSNSVPKRFHKRCCGLLCRSSRCWKWCGFSIRKLRLYDFLKVYVLLYICHFLA